MMPDAPASTAGIPGIGEVLAQRYRIERSLGRGSMGAVFAAEHVSLRQRVAIKFLLPHVLHIPGASARFLREARTAAALRSEHVARVLDVGTVDMGEDELDIPYLVMEYLRGHDLQQVLDARGPLPVTEAVDYVLQACEAIAEAHARGFIHRDLKPGNFFLTTGPTGAPLVKVLDFGLSKSADLAAEDGKLTATEMMLGSPCYMSPEQVRSARDVDSRTDVWSLGVVLYQLLTARFPFEVPSISGLFVAIVTEPPTPPRARRADLPVAIEDIILRCLEKNVAQRIQSVVELARQLAPFGTEHAARALEQIEAFALDRASPPPLARPPAAQVGVTLQAAATPLPGAGAGERAGSRPSRRATAIAPHRERGGSEPMTLRSPGVESVSSPVGTPGFAEVCTLIAPSDDGPTLAMARSEGPTLTMARDDGPTLAMARSEGPTLAMARDERLDRASRHDEGAAHAASLGAAVAAHAASRGDDVAADPASFGADVAAHPASFGAVVAAHPASPGVDVAAHPASLGDDVAAPPASLSEEGPTLLMARGAGATLAMARRPPGDPQSPRFEESVGSIPVVTDRRPGQQSSFLRRARRGPRLPIAAAVASTAAAVLAVALWTQRPEPPPSPAPAAGLATPAPGQRSPIDLPTPPSDAPEPPLDLALDTAPRPASPEAPSPAEGPVTTPDAPAQPARAAAAHAAAPGALGSASPPAASAPGEAAPPTAAAAPHVRPPPRSRLSSFAPAPRAPAAADQGAHGAATNDAQGGAHEIRALPRLREKR